MVRPILRAILFISTIFALNGCAVKKGCPSNGANVGAERVLSGDPKATKAINKGKKYKLNKF